MERLRHLVVLPIACSGTLLLPTESAASPVSTRIEERAGLSKESDSYHTTREVLGKSFGEYESEHYLVLSDADREWTRAQLRRLERTYTQFRRYAARMDLHADPLRHKLVCILFQERRAYAEFGRLQDRVFAKWNHGYYSPGHDRVVLFNGEAEADADEFAAHRTIATTVHEAIHQLHYHTNVLNKHVQYPLWSSEGIATSFETTETERPFGPEQEFGPRRERFERLLRQDALIPLERLVQCDRMPDNRRETVFAVYNQSYALVSWLAVHRPSEYRDYLRRMQQAKPGRLDPATHLETFKASFGDPRRVEEAWLREEIRRVGAAAVSPELIRRMKVSAQEPHETIAYAEERIHEAMPEEHDDENHWLDDVDLACAAHGMQHLPGVPGAPAPLR